MHIQNRPFRNLIYYKKGSDPLIQIFIGLLIGVGTILIVSDMLRIPFINTTKAINNLFKRHAKKTSNIELWLTDFSIWVSKRIKLNEYKRLQLVSDLQTAGINISPELHIAKALIKAGICGLLTIPAFIIFPLIASLVITISITVYFRESNYQPIKLEHDQSIIKNSWER